MTRQETSWRDLDLSNLNEKYSTCSCCENPTHRVWGWVNDQATVLAAYFVSYTPCHRDHGAKFQIVLGRWGEQTTPDDRSLVELDYRVHLGPAALMVVDPTQPSTLATVAKHALRRDQVVGRPIAATVFTIVDAIDMKDPRLNDVRQWTNPPH